MKKIIFVLLFCSMLLTIAPASALDFEETYAYHSTLLNSYSYPSPSAYTGAVPFNRLLMSNPNDYYNGLWFFSASSTAYTTSVPDISNKQITFYSDSAKTNEIGNGLISWDTQYNILGQKINTDLWINIIDFDYANKSGSWVYFTINGGYTLSARPMDNPYNTVVQNGVGGIALSSTSYSYSGLVADLYQIVNRVNWENQISGNYGEVLNNIDLIRDGFRSNLTVYDFTDAVIFTDVNTDDVHISVLDTICRYEITNSYDQLYAKILPYPEDTTKRIKVLTHVWSNADDSLIGGALVTYNATDGSDYQSQTLRTGEGIFNLLPGVEYAFTAEADGYVMQKDSEPVISFTGDTQFGIYMTPVGTVTPGLGLVNFKVYEYTLSGSVIPLKNAIIEVGNTTLLTNSAGYNSFTIDKNATLSYKVYKEGYNSFSISYKPIWTQDAIDEYVFLRSDDLVIPGEPTAEPTPDRRTANQKAESAANIIFDNIEDIAYLGAAVTILALVEMMAGGGKKR